MTDYPGGHTVNASAMAPESGRWPVVHEHLEGGLFIDGEPQLSGWLERGRETAETRSATTTRPDLSWKFSDGAGHFHAYDRNGGLPTLVREEKPVGCGDPDHEPSCDGYAVTVWQCRVCAQQIEPRRIPETGVQVMSGREFWHGLVVGFQVHRGTVSVRLTCADGRTYFGSAYARVDVVEGGRHGVRVTTRLTGIGTLGMCDPS